MAAATRAGLGPVGHNTRPIARNTLANRGDAVRNNFHHYDYFHHGWYANHPGCWFAAGWAAGRPWGWTAWPALYGWYGGGGGGSAQPIYYDYGSNVTYQGDQVYYGDQPEASAADYYQQAADLAASGQSAGSTPPKGDDWTPLGVFSLVQGEQSDSAAVFQLAVDRSGNIGGNYCDMLSGTTLTVHGAVDKKTQRAAWTVGDNKDTVYEAGIANLTRDQTTVLVHFGKDRTQQWMLVRIKQPEGGASSPGPATPPPDGADR